MKGRKLLQHKSKREKEENGLFQGQKKKGDEGKNDSSTQVIEGETRKVFEVSEFLSVCRMQYM